MQKKDRTIYEKVQVDSEVERHFVDVLNNSTPQTGGVILYFKFPPKYKINLPKIIGNYNPDWAIVRRDETEQQLELVRETKGTSDLTHLWHLNEVSKIICAQKHFKAVGLDYRFIDGKKTDTYYLKWWEKDVTNYRNVLLGKNKKDYDDLFKIILSYENIRNDTEMLASDTTPTYGDEK